MLYQLIRPLANISFRTVLRKINVIDADKFPKDVPVILACNHPTAFLEPCLLACFIDRPLYFIVRGDFFKNRFLRKLMFGVHLIPIHRMEGGRANIKKNHKIFNYCYDSLENNETILIMVEGKTRQHKRLGPLKKGTGRIALGFMDSRLREDALVVPVAVNFTKANDWRSAVTIVVGDSIPVTNFKEEMQEHPNVGFEALNDVMISRLRDKMIFIENEEDDLAVEFMLHFERVDFINSFFPHVGCNREIFTRQQYLAECFNSNPERVEIREEIMSLQNTLKDKTIDWKKLNIERKESGVLVLVLIFPFFIIGLFTNILSFILIDRFVNSKIKQLEFMGPVRLALILATNLFVWPILIFMSLYLASIPLLIIYILKPLFGFILLKYWDRYGEFIHTRRFRKQELLWKKDFEEKLVNIRKHIFAN